MTSSLTFATRHFDARVAELGFSAEMPVDWIHHALPEEDLDVGNPTAFVPLAVLTAPYAAIVLAVAARPAHDDGTLHDWAWYHLNQQSLQPRAVGRSPVAGVPGVCGEAVQTSDLGPIVVRFAFLEDGGRLINLTLTAPEGLAGAVQGAWSALLNSFTLHTPRGSRFEAQPSIDPVPAEPEPGHVQPAAPPDLSAVRDRQTGEPATRPDGLPRWWHEALAMEAQGRLDEAERHIRESCPFIGFAHATADLYRLRMLRLKDDGDAAGARQAFLKASDFIGRYASMATSGGEGAALSLERDAFRARLVAAHGSDPEARC